MAAKKGKTKKTAAKSKKSSAKTKKIAVSKKVKASKKASGKKVPKLKVKKTTVKAKAQKKIVTKPNTKKPTLRNSANSSASTLPKVKIDYTKVITPLLDRVVVRVLAGERVTAGGIIIPDSASLSSGYVKAEVLAIGTGIKTKKGHLRPLDVKVGDTVLFPQYAGTKVEFYSQELHIINESDVMGIVQGS